MTVIGAPDLVSNPVESHVSGALPVADVAVVVHRAVLIVLAAVVVLALRGGATVALGATWAAMPPPSGPEIQTGRLTAVGCAPGACVALGSSAAGPLALSWHGRSWILGSVPTPGGDRSVSFGPLSCGSVRFCVALGAASQSPGASFLEVWDGRRWNLAGRARPALRPGDRLNGIGCGSGKLCELVGSMQTVHGPTVGLAERWDGTAWRRQRLPAVAGARASELQAVSCASARWCVAVGAVTRPTQPGSPTVSFADAWDGVRWTRFELGPQPAGAKLLDVSCASADYCLAVGSVSSAMTYASRPLAELWARHRWTILAGADRIRTAGNPADSGFARVACDARHTCLALGTYAYGTYCCSVTGEMTERWTGKRWSLEAESDSGPGFVEMNGVSCGAPGMCKVVGSDGVGCDPPPTSCTEMVVPKIFGLNNSDWKTENAPGASSPAPVNVTAATCPSPTMCLAVGSSYIPSQHRTSVADVWDGSAWRLASAPGGGLSSLTCPSATFCMALADLAPGRVVLVEWNGFSWSALSPQPPFPPLAVTCSSAAQCAVIRAANPTSAYSAFWNGSNWTVAPTQTVEELTAISCASASFCEAVGWATTPGPTNPLQDGWNGTSWTLHASNRLGSLQSVSCPTSNFCLAVGEGASSSSGTASTWDGANWNDITPPPGPANDVSCTSSTRCVATGAADASGLEWDGSAWNSSTSALGTRLVSVSCSTSSGQCAAVGTSTAGATIVERASL